ncbi:MAG: ABC-type transporter, periplasmic subunit [Bacilli bacterium]|nr:ABC-type transporter, periplasmic subunit [Bacilli bacterium]
MKKWMRKSLSCSVAATVLSLLVVGCGNSASTPESKQGSGGTLIIGATFSNLPNMDVYPDQGYEGRRFVGNQLYDPLIIDNPNTNSFDPGLASSWESKDMKVWTFHLRSGVKFQDGTAWNASSAVFNLDRILNKNFQYYYPQVAALLTARTKEITSYQAIDDMTLEITLKEQDSFFPSDVTQILFASPTAIQKYGNDDYQNHPVGTGPFAVAKVVPRQELDLVPNKDYWRGAPKLDQLILKPMSDPATRYAALLSSQINWAEVPPTETIPQIKQKGFQVVTKPYPHIWAIVPDMSKPPFNDKRVREAFVRAIDRKAMSDQLLNGASIPADGPMYPESNLYPKDAPAFDYNLDLAKQLLTAAGYPNGVTIAVNMPSSGSGNMWPLPMSEFIQQQEAKIGINITFRTYDWNQIITQYRAGFSGPMADANGIAYSLASGTLLGDLETSFVLKEPQGSDIMGYDNPQLDQLVRQAKASTDPAGRDKLLAQGWGIVQSDIALLPVVHDLNLRVLSPKVQGLVTPATWFVDLTTVWVSK